MIIHSDIKGLEVVTAGYLSQDPILCDEIRNGKDFHADNQARFGLPNRTIAKVFVFKLIYGATDWGYANDSDFMDVSTNVKFWTDIIEEFYNKYPGIAKWHNEIVQTVMRTGFLTMPTGRVFTYPQSDVIQKMWYWRPKILNYPVQGTGADLVCIARVTADKRLRAAKLPVKWLWQSTVHDSMDIDYDHRLDKDLEMCYTIAKIIKESIEDVPQNFYRLFGKEFNLPFMADIGYGMNLTELTPIKL